MAGLLLARGLLKRDPTGLFYGPSLAWLPSLGPRDVINAIFQHDCKTMKDKLLVVHVDELACLDKGLDHMEQETRRRALKDLVNPLSEYNTGESQTLEGKVLAIITHTSPSPWQPLPTEIGIRSLLLAPLSFEDSVKVITCAGVTFNEETLQDRRALNASAGHPALLVALRTMLTSEAYHLGNLFHADVTVAHREGLNTVGHDVCREVARVILMQETVEVEPWRDLLQRGLLLMRVHTNRDGSKDRAKCKLACPYPMLVNILTCQNAAFKALVPPRHQSATFSYDCFEVVTALKIAAEYGDIGAFVLRSDIPLRDKLMEIKNNAAQERCVFLSKTRTERGSEGAIEGAGLNKLADGIVQLDVFQCKHAEASDTQQDIEEIRGFAQFVKEEIRPLAKGLGCKLIVATFATDRLKKDWTANSDLLAEATEDGIKCRFRLFTRNARVGTGTRIASEALMTWLPDG
eukprot:6455728-Amphidinium_carterae.1